MNSNISIRLSRQQSRLIDEIAIGQFGIPGIVLMENAGRNCAEHILQHTLGPVLVCCGSGNNGGDGFVIARHLAIAQREVSILLVGSTGTTNDAATNLSIVRKMNLPLETVVAGSEAPQVENAFRFTDRSPAVIVDALLGTGATGNLRSPYDTIVETANKSKAVRIAIDIPTGVDCDSGVTSGAAFNADTTLTLVARKTGFAAADADRFTGKVEVIGIGIPQSVVQLAITRD